MALDTKKTRKKGLKRIKSFFKKGEFSKMLCGLICLIIGGIGIYSIVRYHSLCAKAIELNSSIAPDPSIAVACVSVLLGAFLSYCFYQFGLKNSRNKFNIDKNGIPFEAKIKEYIDNYLGNNGGNDLDV